MRRSQWLATEREWLKFLLAHTEEEIEMIAQKNPEIRKAAIAGKDVENEELRARLGS